jgi:hypothetical protein
MAAKSMFIHVNNGQDGEHYPEPTDGVWWVAVSTPGRMDNPDIRHRNDRELLEYVTDCISDGDCFIANEPLHHTTGGWLCMPVPIREGQDRKSIYEEAEYLAEFFSIQIGSRKMRVDREALWHSHPRFDMEDSMIIPTQIVLPSEDATKVRKYPICFGDVPPPAPATDIADLTNPSLTMKVSDRDTEVARLLSYTGFLVSEYAKPHHSENEEIMEASIRVEEMAGRLQGPHSDDKEYEACRTDFWSRWSELWGLLRADGGVAYPEVQESLPKAGEVLEDLTNLFNSMQVAPRHRQPAEILAPIAARFDQAERIPQCIDRWETMTKAVYDGDLGDNDVDTLLKERGIQYAELDDLIESDCQDMAAKLKDVEVEGS